MSKLQVKIDGELLKSGQLFIHGDSEPEAVTSCGKTTVDIEAIKKHFEEMVRKEIGNG
jgi:hypothetical protein